METDERIIYSKEETLLSIEMVLNKIRAFLYDPQYKMLGNSFIENISKWEQVLQARKNDPLTVAVIGDFKRGKSTFINALLGAEIVPSNVTPETVTVNRITYGGGGNEAVLSGHKRMRISDEELKREKLQQIIAGASEPIRRLEMKRPIDLLKKIDIIDTPGLGGAGEECEELTEEAIRQADVLVYVYNIKYPLSMSEQMFLKTAVLTKKHTKLFLVGNFADTIEDEHDFGRMRELLQERVEQLLPDAEVIMLSALDELCRKTDKERPNPELASLLEQEFGKFCAQLEKLVEEKADEVVIDRLQRLTGEMFNQLLGELDVVEKGLSINRTEAAYLFEKLNKEKDAQEKKLENTLKDIAFTTDNMEKEASGWMTGFMRRIENETEKLSDRSSEEIRKYYSFYCTDLVSEALSACIAHHSEAMFDKLTDISETAVNALASGFMSGEIRGVQMNLDNRIWTRGDTIGLAFNLLPGRNFLETIFSLGANAVAGSMRQKEVQKRTSELVDQIRSGFTQLEISMNETLKSLYKKLSDSSKKIITDVISDEIQEMQRRLTETVSVAGMEEAHKEKVRIAVNAAKALLAECEAAMAP